MGTNETPPLKFEFLGTLACSPPTEVQGAELQGVENPKSKWTSIGSPFAVFQLHFGIFSIYVVNMILFVIRKPFFAEGPCRCYEKTFLAKTS